MAGTMRPTQPIALADVDPQDAERWLTVLTALDDESGNAAPSETRERQAVWLSVYASTFNGAHATRVVGITPAAVDGWRKHPTFAAALEHAQSEVRENVAGEVYRRAVTGVEQGIWHMGKRVGVERKYSDAMLKALAERVDPAWSNASASVPTEAQASALVRAVLASAELRALAEALADGAAGELAQVPTGERAHT